MFQKELLAIKSKTSNIDLEIKILSLIIEVNTCYPGFYSSYDEW